MKFAWKRFKELSGPERRALLDRTPSDEEAEAAVRPILDAVAREGDGAVRTWSEKLDGVRLESLRVPEEEMSRAVDAMPKVFFDALETARRNLEIFHTAEKPPFEVTAAPQDGVELRRLWRPFERVGFYVPGGGAAYPSTVLMLAVPARVAGCRDMALASPPDREGRVARATLAAARFAGVEEVYRIGGAMAVGAFAYGTRSVPAVQKIFGPGSRYVAAAKQLVADRTAVDLPAGPSEVLVLADESAEPRFCAADLLSQAEHGPDSIAVLVTTSERVARETASEVEKQLEKSPRREILEAALRQLRLLVVDSIDDAVALANDFAPEHMVLMVEAEDEVLGGVRCAGSVLLGNYAPVAAGDYAAGINHVLPTGGAARTRSALSVLDFGRMMQVSRISRSGLESLRGAIVTLAETETLAAHAEAVRERFRLAAPAPAQRVRADSLVRTHLRGAEAYVSARHLAQEGIFFDANENAFGSVLAEADAGASQLNRYPDPLQRDLRSALAAYAGAGAEQVFAGSGSDEAIDCLLKAFVEPGEAVVVCTPTYGMYAIAATLHGAEVREAPLDGAFDLDVDAVLRRGRDAKLVFCCSPNNPTGNLLSRDRVFALCEGLQGLVVLDEAYLEFAKEQSLASEIKRRSNLVVLRTLSKAWGLAAARVGYAVAAADVVSYLLKVKMPYNMNKLSEGAAMAALARTERLAELRKRILAERDRLAERLGRLGARVYPSEANFLLVRVPGAAEAAKALAGRGLIVRTWSREPRLEDCMRITVGRPEENEKLLEALASLIRKEA